MRFDKYMAIYKNDNLEIDGDTVKGKCLEVMEYLKYEIAHQCMGDIDYQELIWNVRKIVDILAELEDNEVNDNEIIVIRENPMGSLYYEIEGKE